MSIAYNLSYITGEVKKKAMLKASRNCAGSVAASVLVIDFYHMKK